MSKYFPAGTIIRNKAGALVKPSSLDGKMFGIYFSAHWCPPCRSYTPVLAEQYNKLIAAGKSFEVVFVSADNNTTAAAAYFSEMPWTMLDYSDRDLESKLAREFDVSGIPSLVLIDRDESGEVLTTDGRFLVLRCAPTSMTGRQPPADRGGRRV